MAGVTRDSRAGTKSSPVCNDGCRFARPRDGTAIRGISFRGPGENGARRSFPLHPLARLALAEAAVSSKPAV